MRRKGKYPNLLSLLVCGLMVIILSGLCCLEEPHWSITEKDGELQIAYGSKQDFPQYAALHLKDSYFRMNYGPESGWGTSVILLPCFWEAGVYYQGAPISVTWDTVESKPDLVISFTGTISSLTVEGEVIIEPPKEDSIQATVIIKNIEGDVVVDDRPGEAFKPVMLSSMHVSEDLWDAQSAYVDSQSFPIPEEGWIIQPPVEGTVFGLKGGTSDWKTNAPTIEVTLTQGTQITGWVTRSGDPDGDNVGFWAALDQIIRSWQYKVVAKP